jgi:hypothetical protein
MASGQTGENSVKSERNRRLAEALRDNLRRRKEQSRSDRAAKPVLEAPQPPARNSGE